ncbi:hypothetical protein K523DRAFT_352049 [Schizophyllum commune Tattone D]|nr:hypothetical protein K523DRAFT_352049 [Schizophyllum commune Tattone D]
MRVKLQCLPPLPALKFWYAVEGEKIEDLKKSLAKNVPGLGPAGTGLQVLLDDFELLDWQSTDDLLRDGDLLVVKRSEKATTSMTTQTTTMPKPAAGKKRKRSPSTSSSSSESSDDSSDSSDDTSDSDDDSDSDDTSSSDSSSDSDSSDDESPLVQSSKKPLKQPAAKKPAVATKPPAVTPPGQGKTTTRERNRRRRAQRLRQSQGVGDIEMALPPKALSLTNGTPLGASTSRGAANVTNALAGSMWSEMDFDAPLEDSSTPIANFNGPLSSAPDYSELTMFSLRNKNKSKNFRKNMKMQVPAGPKRIVFADEVGAGHAQAEPSKDGGVAASKTGATTSRAQPVATIPKAQVNRHQTRLPRLVPPSERTDLPPNVFVTSVDVEAGWEADTSGYQYDTSAYEQSYAADADEEGANIQLSYDEPSADATTNTSTTAQHCPYPALAQSYASATGSQPLASLAQLGVGIHVGWTSLELNAATMTPEMTVVIAKVVGVDDKGESGDAMGDGRNTAADAKQTVTVKRMPKPLEGEAHELLLNVAGEGEEEKEQEEETFTLKEAVDAGWRVIL